MDGILNINKPVGMSSFDVVKSVRAVSGTKKVGHAGTLDPGASGVLPICIGHATKLVDYIMKDEKIYIARLKLGIETDTYDKYGKILSEKRVDASRDEVENAVMSFVGNIQQVPPMYSALKVNGRRLYELARKGIEIERKSRNIVIHNMEILELKLPYVTIKVKCSKGTYIRSLCHDIGCKLGCGGTMWDLVRTHTGKFDILESVPISELDKDSIFKYLIPMEDVLSRYPSLHVGAQFEKHVLNGIIIHDKNFLNKVEENILYKVYIGENNFIGIGMNKKDIGFKMIKLLIRGN
ncbi:MAG: tRNA pseudouridine(55) synthase TruB [Clostridium sp.]|jgi:tRNA pseudouridine55 synthase|uniref:tRNA pseudouridine(55) synthase TruB n=1 Tax=Clostridium sp. TaxID=1506 RepID=UPI0025C4E5DF|nr:tRNA pseudouridine(55) synthase TruB [Clostridium sp.]MCH3963979.1 tRNA pseudouridine(55) synthase TruB [Clostridium sp.]MCI1716180.1 tRNA pseudouridine(55) synthase TruB [Clostridium sp.]MCI1800580.1 tRNA pseudouridine(55) synthase TruB [Clostridium sp.]MCI1814357.1 tRNA pseudouridine(55) synthase TruB [Clostridium sp.]MCI1871256.1 tRNA pseudouridine(55) synthase TruB [Clostridium sp.]